MSGAESLAPNPAAYLLQALLSLVFVIALIYGAYHLLRRVTGKASLPSGAGPATIIQSLPLHAGNVLHVVRIGAKVHLLTSGPQGVTAVASDVLVEGEADEA
ncbi:MAG: FliO/MopB family protein [Armatimonadota bacterium]